jgi:hypothetical protein
MTVISCCTHLSKDVAQILQQHDASPVLGQDYVAQTSTDTYILKNFMDS